MRDVFLQDDTYLREQANFTSSDGRGFMLHVLDHPILAVLEQQLGIDLSAFRRVAYDDEGWIRHEVRDADDAQRRIAELQRQNAAAWQPPDQVARTIERLLAALEPGDTFPEALLAACRQASGTEPFDAEYLAEGWLHQDLRDVRAMVDWSIMRGARLVRFLVR